jgi:hypothetical protein
LCCGGSVFVVNLANRPLPVILLRGYIPISPFSFLPVIFETVTAEEIRFGRGGD